MAGTSGSDVRRRPPLGFGVLMIVLAALLVVSSVLGPLGLDVVDYPVSESLVNQMIGLEVVTLLLVVPWAVWSGILALRDHPAAPLLAFGPAAYAAYMFVQYVVGPEYPTYSAVALFHVAVSGLAGGLVLRAWSLARDRPTPAPTPSRRRWLAWLSFGLAAFVVSRYADLLAGAGQGHRLTAEYADEPTFFWSIVLLDLGCVVPLTVAAGVTTLRDTPAGRRAPYAVLGWFALVPPSVAAMGVAMLVRDDPLASTGTVVMLSLVSVAFAAVAVAVLHALFASSAEGADARRPPGAPGGLRSVGLFRR
ncbi:hypothetical protein [Nocardioides guangzhouensis]|uniref:hypothetical protein n=1 Tax=Nocardioides guangzhouensis TaxID=2497878 RepID=UPI00158CADD6|nr:hypothetical protein [Nocardioides guangzhouensis]